MPKFTGRQQEIGIGKEGARGTGIAPTYWLPKTAVTFDNKSQQALVRGSYGNIADAVMTAQVVKKWAEGDIEGEINISSFGLILLSLLGLDTPSNPETGVYLHTYTLDNDTDHPSLSIQIQDPIADGLGTDMRFRLAMINSLNVEIPLGEVVKYTANFMSKVKQDVVQATPSYSIDNRFVHPNLTFKVASEIGSLAAASKIDVKSLNFTIEKDVEMVDVLGTLEPEDIVNKTIRIFGSIELNYENRTWRDYMMNGTARAMQIKLTSTKRLGATQYPDLELVFPKVRFDEWDPNHELGELATQTINFEVMYDLSNTRLWSTLALQNGVASY